MKNPNHTREEIYNLLACCGLFPEEQKGCCKEMRGTDDLLYVDKYIIKEVNTRRENLLMALITKKLWRGPTNSDNRMTEHTFFIDKGIVYWINMTRKSGKHCARHTKPLDSCFNFIKFHQQSISWSSPLEIERATTECRAGALPLSYLSTSHTSDPKLTSPDKCMSISLSMRL